MVISHVCDACFVRLLPLQSCRPPRTPSTPRAESEEGRGSAPPPPPSRSPSSRITCEAVLRSEARGGAAAVERRCGEM